MHKSTVMGTLYFKSCLTATTASIFKFKSSFTNSFEQLSKSSLTN